MALERISDSATLSVDCRFPTTKTLGKAFELVKMFCGDSEITIRVESGESKYVAATLRDIFENSLKIQSFSICGSTSDCKYEISFRRNRLECSVKNNDFEKVELFLKNFKEKFTKWYDIEIYFIFVVMLILFICFSFALLMLSEALDAKTFASSLFMFLSFGFSIAMILNLFLSIRTTEISTETSFVAGFFSKNIARDLIIALIGAVFGVIIGRFIY
jgi:ABC-type multidrug transport system fused ATPase/permease subunit